jgi:hypothetical protein
VNRTVVGYVVLGNLALEARMMQVLEVGKLYKEGITHYQECAKFDFDNSGALLFLFLSHPTDEEILAIRKGDYGFAVCELSGVMFFLSKFGGLKWMDAPYSPHLSKSVTFQTVTDGTGYSLNVLLVDAATGVLRGMRLIGLPTKFSRQLRASIDQSLQQSFDATSYDSAIAAVYNKHSTDEMVPLAQYYCKG